MFVDVYSKATGRQVRVPEHFLTHPELSQHFRKTPPPSGGGSSTPARNHRSDKTPAAGEKE